jgi:hypothetical protein
MKPADLLKENRPPCILIYGPADSGKTGLVAQLLRAYGFDFDEGMKTAATLKDKFFDARNQIVFDEYKDLNPSKPNKFPLAMKKMQSIARDVAAGKWNFDGLVVDSLTGLCRAAQLYHLFVAKEDPFAKMDPTNYLAVRSLVDKFLTYVRAVRVPTIVTAHVEIQDEAPDKQMQARKITAIHPASATKSHGFRDLLWMFDEVWYAEKKPAGQGKMKYMVTGNKHGIIQTRTRSSFGSVRHDDIGLEKVLEMAGYRYENNK